MSLFGESPPEAAPIQSKSLFGEERAPAASTSSLFADDAESSAWSIPTAKKNARQNLVKNLLSATDVPESYVDAFDAVSNAGEKTGVGISLEGVNRVLQNSDLSTGDQDRIRNFVVPDGQEPANGFGRSEFNVLLALIGLGQEGEEITLDSVDERRRRLPKPNIPYIDNINQTKSQAPAPSTIRSRPQQNAFGDDLAADPWASPATQNIPPSVAAHTLPTNGFSGDFSNSASYANGASRTTSTFTTTATEDAPGNGGDSRNSNTVSATVWNSYSGGNEQRFSDQPTLSGGFGDEDNDRSRKPDLNTQRSTGASVVLSPGTGESVTVSLLPEKEGLFLFQHRNYEVKALRRGSSVVRRYSDFVWLLDCLQKRYPFRRLPLLPPKRLQVNGNHFAVDAPSFLEKRRRGLVRFVNALVQHPTLSQETLVVMFLTVPTELTVWRKQATISVQEEFVGKALPPTLEDSLPSNLSELFEQVRAGVKRSTEIYINLCVLLERLVKRNEGLAADNARFSEALQLLVDCNNDTYAVDTNDVPLMNGGILSTAKHMVTSQSLLEDEAAAWDTDTLEDFKKIRDALVSMRDMFDRRDRYARDNIPQLERKIEASENKLQQLRAKPSGAVKPGEMEKVEGSIMSDKESIVQQHARGVFIKECIRDEIVNFQTSIHATSRMHQDWSQERVKYAELQANNWRTLVDDVESMPLGE